MRRRITERIPFIALILLFPAWFAFHGFTNNYPSVPSEVIVMLFAKYLSLSAVTYFIFYFILKTHVKAAAAFFFTSLLFYSFGYLHEVMVNNWKGYFFTKYSFILPCLLIVYAVGLWLIWKKMVAVKWIRFFNVTLIVWILIDVFIVIQLANKKQEELFTVRACSDCARPDVHLIVVDSYAGYNQLQDEFAFDNTPFLDSLKSLGFQLPAVSIADYPRTEFSMASMLNMNYDTLRNYTVTPETLKYCGERIAENAVVGVFKKTGLPVYQQFHF